MPRKLSPLTRVLRNRGSAAGRNNQMTSGLPNDVTYGSSPSVRSAGTISNQLVWVPSETLPVLAHSIQDNTVYATSGQSAPLC